MCTAKAKKKGINETTSLFSNTRFVWTLHFDSQKTASINHTLTNERTSEWMKMSRQYKYIKNARHQNSNTRSTQNTPHSQYRCSFMPIFSRKSIKMTFKRLLGKWFFESFQAHTINNDKSNDDQHELDLSYTEWLCTAHVGQMFGIFEWNVNEVKSRFWNILNRHSILYLWVSIWMRTKQANKEIYANWDEKR